MDHPLDSLDSDGTFRHRIPMQGILRVILLVAGVFVIAVSVWELWRGVWPLNVTSPFFALLLAGALSVGVPVAGAGLLAPATTWIVRPGRIEIAMVNPFGRRIRRLTPAAVAGFSFREQDSDGGPNTWCVVLETTSGDRFETRSYGSLAAATELRDRIEAIFRP